MQHAKFLKEAAQERLSVVTEPLEMLEYFNQR
jgi:hypothetical protein